MGKYVNILDDLTINKISAGEVVERPSSVVKELLENAIDSGATQVVVEIVDGGKKSIKISDNGCGILSSEVEKCFLRHATSKIKDIDDLYNLYSLGFRGEALASICSVSNIEMVTKSEDEPVGTKIVLSGSKIVKKEAVGCKNGTTITIKDLFFNTPVRAKFLKSTHAETMSISELVNKIAIGNPNIRIRYSNNSRPMLNSPGDNNLLSAIRSIYGKDITDNLVRLEYEDEKIKLSGYIGNNNIYRSNKNLQHVYINKRYVKSKVVLDAINESYKGIIPINKFAVCFLNIDLNPNEVDVNIHPTKLEVKFQDENDVYIKIRDVIKDKLLNISLIGRYKVENNFTKVDRPKEINNPKNDLDLNIKKEEATLDLKNDLSSFKTFKEALEDDKKKQAENQKIEDKNPTVNYENKVVAPSFFNEALEDEISVFRASDYRVVGTILNTYVVLEKGSSMYLLDQHAAHEKVLYEEYMTKFKKQDIDMQILLDPIIMELSNLDMLDVEKNLGLFIKFGFEIELFGDNHIMIRGVPNIFGVAQCEKFIFQIIDNIASLENSYDLKIDKIASMACRAAIKANDKIHLEEIDSLLKKMEGCENPYTCPHGRPSIVEISKKEIEKMFKRIM